MRTFRVEISTQPWNDGYPHENYEHASVALEWDPGDAAGALASAILETQARSPTWRSELGRLINMMRVTGWVVEIREDGVECQDV